MFIYILVSKRLSSFAIKKETISITKGRDVLIYHIESEEPLSGFGYIKKNKD